MFCKYCGARLDSGDRFCSSCGANIAPVQSAQPPAAPVINVYQEPPRAAAAPAQAKHTIGLLALIFGAIALAGSLEFLFEEVFSLVMGFMFCIPAFVLGIIGTVKKQKYANLGMWMAIAAFVMFIINVS